MKHTTIYIMSAICIMSIFMCSSISHAASITVTAGAPSTAYQVDLISSGYYEDDSTTPPTTCNYFTYEFYFSPYITTAEDSYKNGVINIMCTIDNYMPTGCTKTGITFDFEYSNTETIIGRMIDYNDYGGRRVMLSYYLNNYGLKSSIPAGRVKCRVTFKASGLQWASFNINPTVSYTVISSTSVYATAEPQDMGFASVIKEAITNALSVGELDLVYDYLVFWKTTQDGYLADIELSLHDMEIDNDTIIQWLSYINTVQVSQDQKLELIRQLISTFPSYSAQMLQYIQQIINMNASQEAQQQAIESQYQNKENISASLSDGMNTPMPSVGNVGVGGYIDVGTQNSFNGFISLIASNGFIIKMFLIAITLGIVSYALYGKKG